MAAQHADCLPDVIASLKATPEAEPAARDVSREMMLWKLTVAGNAAAEPDDSNLSFRVVRGLKHGAFEASTQGRMDTITAPELLKQFRNAGGEIRAIRADVSRVAYMSSAGLRVLLMMYNRWKNKDCFELNGVSDEAREMLETTGLDRFLPKQQ